MRGAGDKASGPTPDRGRQSDIAVVAMAVGSMFLLLVIGTFLLWLSGAVYEDGPE